MQQKSNTYMTLLYHMHPPTQKAKNQFLLEFITVCSLYIPSIGLGQNRGTRLGIVLLLFYVRAPDLRHSLIKNLQHSR